MPKIVDHQKQRKLVAEAAWRVILRDGIEQASVRHIAEEAGISAGSMRHYFSSQSELFLYAMNLVSERVSERLNQLQLKGEPLDNVRHFLMELLPTSDEKMAEMGVWYAFTAKSKADPALRKQADKVYGELRQAIANVVLHLVQQDLAMTDLDQELETERLYALIDGLAVHAVLRPEQVNNQIMEDVLMRHLTSLCRGEQ